MLQVSTQVTIEKSDAAMVLLTIDVKILQL